MLLVGVAAQAAMAEPIAVGSNLYATDAEIRYYDIAVLADDLRFFPSYEVVWLYRADLPAGAGHWRSSLPMAARAMLLGTAKPMPTFAPVGPMMAVLMPTTSPARLTSGPPEFPGLMDASVWM